MLTQNTIDDDDRIETACEWIIDLATRRFKQTHSVLKDRKGYCCLGVAQTLTHTARDAVDYEKSDDMLDPVEARVNFGISDTSAQSALVRLNDISEYSFPEIAKELICHPEEYFVPAVAVGVSAYFSDPANAKDLDLS